VETKWLATKSRGSNIFLIGMIVFKDVC